MTILEEFYNTLNLPIKFDSLSEASISILENDKNYIKFRDQKLKKEDSIDYSFVRKFVSGKSIIRRIFNN